MTFHDPEAARKACENSSPVIDGRRANCNLAALGRLRPHFSFGSCFFWAILIYCMRPWLSYWCACFILSSIHSSIAFYYLLFADHVALFGILMEKFVTWENIEFYSIILNSMAQKTFPFSAVHWWLRGLIVYDSYLSCSYNAELNLSFVCLPCSAWFRSIWI